MSIKKHVLACMIFLSGSFGAAAMPVTYDFTGSIDFISDFSSGSDLNTDIDQNTSTISGSFNYDVDALFDGIQYNTAITGFNFDINTFAGLVSVSVADDGRMLVTSTGWSFDRGTPDAITLPNSAPDFLGQVKFGVEVNLPLAPALPFDLSIFTSGILELQFQEETIYGPRPAGRAVYSLNTITVRDLTPPTPSVPEPAPLALLGLGLVGLGFMKHRKVQS